VLELHTQILKEERLAVFNFLTIVRLVRYSPPPPATKHPGCPPSVVVLVMLCKGVNLAPGVESRGGGGGAPRTGPETYGMAPSLFLVLNFVL